MKKLTLIAVTILLLTTSWVNHASTKKPFPMKLTNEFILPSTIIIENGCSILTNAEIRISNPATNEAKAKFSISFFIDGVSLAYAVTEINGQTPGTHTPPASYTLNQGQSLNMKIRFRFGGNNFLVNKVYKINQKIFHFKSRPGPQPFPNTELSKEISINSPNALCHKCLETQTSNEHLLYSFYIPTSGNCQKKPAFLSEPHPELIQASSNSVSRTFFEIIPNGIIANTTVKKVLIRNKEGKYLSFTSSGIPKYIDRDENNIHNYQDWVIVKTASGPCNDMKYKILQYRDNVICMELYRLKVDGKYTLLMRPIKLFENENERIIIEAWNASEKLNIPNPN